MENAKNENNAIDGGGSMDSFKCLKCLKEKNRDEWEQKYR